ncbi:FkbM family methyltransferase [Bizionia saleffrena]|uniref:FkbM family methyltransferase n=1 Tax=Bizionia saleffrena TaxID=291189 RepID=A0A8H2LF48_9FLAO|nr:FkbM family methyltransferase [Bizionia saleffrena]TYB80168.1 FkbM family methyltransferase [Bizionia saleffrena]
MKKLIKSKLIDFLGSKLNISFARSGDDLQLMKLINENTPGAYVDIGSWHPKKASNTYFFYLRNWKGICIDPNPELKESYARLRPKDVFVNAGIGNSNKNLEYYMFSESSMNTFSCDFIEKNNLESKILKKSDVPVIPLHKILNKYLKATDRLDFFDVDVEGYDLEVLKTNDWNLYRPKIIIVETDLPLKGDMDSSIVKYLETKNYRLLGKTVINNNLGNLFLISN